MVLTRRRSVIAVYAVCIVLMCVGTAFDLRISTELFDGTSTFGTLFAACGMLPVIVAAWTGTALLAAGFAGELTRRRKVALALAGLCSAGSLVALKETYTALPGAAGIALIVLELVLSAVVAWWVWANADRGDRHLLVQVAAVMLVVVALGTAIIHIAKVPWGRPRFRSIVVTEGLEFRPWYVIGSALRKLFAGTLPSEEFRSFPSGHTGAAACALALPLLSRVVPRLRRHEGLLAALALVWCVTVMLSRIVAGAHFLTDVTVGFAVSFTVLVVACRLVVSRDRSRSTDSPVS